MERGTGGAGADIEKAEKAQLWQRFTLGKATRVTLLSHKLGTLEGKPRDVFL